MITNVQYDLPVINVVFSNGKYAFIKDKYEDTNKHEVGGVPQFIAEIAVAFGAFEVEVDAAAEAGVARQSHAGGQSGLLPYLRFPALIAAASGWPSESQRAFNCRL